MLGMLKQTTSKEMKKYYNYTLSYARTIRSEGVTHSCTDTRTHMFARAGELIITVESEQPFNHNFMTHTVHTHTHNADYW